MHTDIDAYDGEIGVPASEIFTDSHYDVGEDLPSDVTGGLE